jgi:hypothetical protein
MTPVFVGGRVHLGMIGGRSFSTRERLALETENTPKMVVFQEKGTFFAIPA